MAEELPGKSELDHDDIVKEIPIYHSTRLQNRLYSFRYPLLPRDLCSELRVRRGFFKPNSKEVKLEVGIEVESPNFDSDRAELLAREVDGPPESRKTSKVFFENDLVDKVTLSSKKPTKDPSKYAALYYNGKEMHLTTLEGVLQLQSVFSYLDKNSRRKRDADHNDLSDEEEAGPSTAQQITVKFKQQDDRWKKSKPNNSKAMEAKSADEAWVECEFCPGASALSKVEKLKLIAENFETTGQAANLTKSEYLRVLIPEGQEEGTTKPTLPSHILPLHNLRSLPILEQCRLLLKNVHVIQFQQLLMTLAGGEGLNAEILLKTLPKVAVLVRGNWVVKSEVLYPSNTLSSTSGVPAELMCRARDYVLYLFTKNQYVERKKVSSVMKIPSEEVKEIFTGFSKLSHNKGWELVSPTDHDFMIKHTEIVQRQLDAWEARFKQIMQFLNDTKRQRRKSKSVSDDKTRNGLVSSDNDSGTEKQKSPIAARKQKSAKIRDSSQDSSS